MLNPLRANPTKWSNTLNNSLTNCLIVFDHLEGLALKALREKCPNTEFFLVRIFSHSDWICISPYSVHMRENTDQKELRIWPLFTQRRLKKWNLVTISEHFIETETRYYVHMQDHTTLSPNLDLAFLLHKKLCPFFTCHFTVLQTILTI